MILQIFLILSFSHLCDCYVVVERTTPMWYAIDSKPVAPFTEIAFEGAFTCPLNTTYCFTGYYLEEDSLSNNEYVFLFPFFCTDNGSLSHNVLVNFTGGDGFFDSWYDPALELFHNCTSDGKTRQILRPFQPVLASGSSYNFTYEEDLMDNGLKFPFKVDYLDISMKWEPSVIDWIYKGKLVYSTKLSKELKLEEMPIMQLFASLPR